MKKSSHKCDISCHHPPWGGNIHDVHQLPHRPGPAGSHVLCCPGSEEQNSLRQPWGRTTDFFLIIIITIIVIIAVIITTETSLSCEFYRGSFKYFSVTLQ